MNVVSFVAASSNSGKTTLIEKVVGILKSRGLRVAVVKHASKGFELDREGKDSWKFRKAGADAVVLVGPDQIAVMKKIDRQPEDDGLEKMIGHVDLVIKEGFKKAGGARIEVFRSGVSAEQPLCARDPSFLALVSDRSMDAGIPWFSLDDAEGVASFLADKFEL